MAISIDQLNAVTTKLFLPTLVNQLTQKIFFMMRLWNKRKVKGAGTKIHQPITFSDEGGGQAYDKTDVFTYNDSDTMTALEIPWKHYHQPIAIHRLDEQANQGREAIQDFLKAKWQNAMVTLKKLIAAGVAGSGTDTDKTLTGLLTIVSQSATYGGIPQATYSWLQAQLDHTAYTMTTDFTDFTEIDKLYLACCDDEEHPSVALTTLKLYAHFKGLMMANQRYTSDKNVANAGWDNILINNQPCIMWTRLGTGKFLWLNEEYLDLFVMKGGQFDQNEGGWIIDPPIKKNDIYFDGNIVCTKCSAQGIMDNITES